MVCSKLTCLKQASYSFHVFSPRVILEKVIYMTLNLVVDMCNNPQSLTLDWLKRNALAVEQFSKKITVIVNISDVTCNSFHFVLSLYFSESHSFKERMHCMLTWGNRNRLGLII